MGIKVAVASNRMKMRTKLQMVRNLGINIYVDKTS